MSTTAHLCTGGYPKARANPPPCFTQMTSKKFFDHPLHDSPKDAIIPP